MLRLLSNSWCGKKSFAETRWLCSKPSLSLQSHPFPLNARLAFVHRVMVCIVSSQHCSEIFSSLGNLHHLLCIFMPECKVSLLASDLFAFLHVFLVFWPSDLLGRTTSPPLIPISALCTDNALCITANLVVKLPSLCESRMHSSQLQNKACLHQLPILSSCLGASVDFVQAIFVDAQLFRQVFMDRQLRSKDLFDMHQSSQLWVHLPLPVWPPSHWIHPTQCFNKSRAWQDLIDVILDKSLTILLIMAIFTLWSFLINTVSLQRFLSNRTEPIGEFQAWWQWHMNAMQFAMHSNYFSNFSWLILVNWVKSFWNCWCCKQSFVCWGNEIQTSLLVCKHCAIFLLEKPAVQVPHCWNLTLFHHCFAWWHVKQNSATSCKSIISLWNQPLESDLSS